MEYLFLISLSFPAFLQEWPCITFSVRDDSDHDGNCKPQLRVRADGKGHEENFSQSIYIFGATSDRCRSVRPAAAWRSLSITQQPSWRGFRQRWSVFSGQVDTDNGPKG